MPFLFRWTTNKFQAHDHINFLNYSQINTKEKDFLNNEEASKNINIELLKIIIDAHVKT